MAKKNTDTPEDTDKQREMVEAMAAYGIPQDQIAACLKMSPTTLRKRYPDELATGATKATAKVAQTLYSIATDINHKQAAISGMFWLKTRAGWKETTIVQGDDKGGPVRIEYVYPNPKG